MSRIVLYSGGDNQANEPLDRHLLKLTGKSSPRMLYIPADSGVERDQYRDFCDYYRNYGVRKFNQILLKEGVDFRELLTIFESDIIFLSGGNTFDLLFDLKQSGMVKILKDYVQAGGVLAGESAGGIVLTPSIRTATFPAFDRDDDHYGTLNLKALYLLPFEFFPHFQNTRRYIHALNFNSRMGHHPIYGVPDGAGIVVDHHQITFYGPVYGFHRGKKFRMTL